MLNNVHMLTSEAEAFAAALRGIGVETRVVGYGGAFQYLFKTSIGNVVVPCEVVDSGEALWEPWLEAIKAGV